MLGFLDHDAELRMLQTELSRRRKNMITVEKMKSGTEIFWVDNSESREAIYVRVGFTRDEARRLFNDLAVEFTREEFCVGNVQWPLPCWPVTPHNVNVHCGKIVRLKN